MEDNKKNQVKLSLEDYLKLYEFRKNFEKEYTPLVCKTQYSYNIPNPIGSNYNGQYMLNYTFDKYITDNDAINELTILNNELAEKAKQLNDQLTHWQNLHRTVTEEKSRLLMEIQKKGIEIPKESVNIEDIKKMSIWQFLKWRKK